MFFTDRPGINYAEMIGVCKGVIADGKICEDEARFLLSWLEANPKAAEVWPGNQLAMRLTKIWQDGKASMEERAGLKELLCELSRISTQANTIVCQNLGNQLPLDAVKIRFAHKSFCFVGKTVMGSKHECENLVLEMGGELRPEPTACLDYLVVGVLGTRHWKESPCGYQIMKAMELRARGCPINFISEEQWVKAITEEEAAELKELIAELSWASNHGLAGFTLDHEIKSIFDDPEPDVKFAGKCFCFIGKTATASRKDCESIVLDMGGEVTAKPNRSLDYLVVGGLSACSWKESVHCAKIIKAMGLQTSGHSVKIISEDCWARALPTRRSIRFSGAM